MIRKFYSIVGKLSSRERLLLLFAAGCLVLTGIYIVAAALEDHVEEANRLAIVRTRDLEDLGRVLKRYQTLNGRLTKLQATFAESQLTFEEVTAQLDKVVRESIGSDKYDLKKGRPPSKLGFEYEKQEFNLKVSSVSLDQVVKLLYNIEQGKSPLFLGKVDILKAGTDNAFGATLEIFSIRKSSTQPTA